MKKYQNLFFLLFFSSALYFCSKKKSDPAPVTTTSTTGTTGSTTGTTNSTSSTSGGTTSSTSGTTTSSAGSNNFNDGTNTYKATHIVAKKSSGTGHINITLFKGIGDFPTVNIQLASPSGPGTYTDDNPNTYGILKYQNENFTSDVLNGNSFSSTINTLTADKIAGTFSFTAKNSGGTEKIVSGNFDTSYTTE